MRFSMPVAEIIRMRRSCRNYVDRPITGELREGIERFITLNAEGPFQTSNRFHLIAAAPGDTEALRDLGTYGFIKGATAFIIGAAVPAPYYLEDYGYLMEEIILYATGAGLGSCWLGGSFRKSSFAGSIKAGPNEEIPAVVALGYRAGKKRVVDSLLRWGAGSDHRKTPEELFFEGTSDRPMSTAEAGEYSEPLEMLRLAPSASNKQPWRIVKEPGAEVFHFFLRRDRGYHGTSSGLLRMSDLQRVDMGIAMCHFELSALERGLEGRWRRIPADSAEIPADWRYLTSWEAAR